MKETPNFSNITASMKEFICYSSTSKLGISKEVFLKNFKGQK